MLLVLAAAAAFAQDLEVPDWEPPEDTRARTGRHVGQAGLYTMAAGGALAGVGAAVMASATCDGCFGPPPDFWGGLVVVGVGTLGVAGSVPLVVAGPMMRSAGLRSQGVPVPREAGWASVGLGATATMSAAWAAVRPRDSLLALPIAGTTLVGSLVCAGVQAGVNDRWAGRAAESTGPGRPTFAVTAYPGGVAVAGTF